MFNQKKKYFKRKLTGVIKMLWDLEFKREKTLGVREGIRHEYDGAQARLEALNKSIEALPKNKKDWTDDEKRLEDDKVRLELDIQTLTSHMKGLDIEVHGSKKTNEYPDGANGIDQQIDALQELKGLLKQYIKGL